MSVLQDLIAMSRSIGRPEAHCVILGEGNTSARCDEDTFYVKASGTNLGSIEAEGLVRVRFDTVLGLLDGDTPPPDTVRETYEAAKVDPGQARRPSVETVFHAVCLSLDGISFVAHTHATAVNKLCCAKGYPDNLRGRMYPDEVIWLGTEAAYVPYADPGVPLARLMRAELERFRDRHGENPRVIYMQNHGFIALGGTPQEVESTAFTAVKAAEIRLGAMAAGGVQFLPEKEVRWIAGRPDEAYRIKVAQE